MIKRSTLFSLMLLLVCSSTHAITGGSMSFTLTSSSFQHGTAIPTKYSCQGQDLSPPLSWDHAPSGTQSFVLIMDDPDAPVGVWDHWILFNIPSTATTLDENVQLLPPGTRSGKNSWGRANYGGPCPPSGTHRYFFKLYALSEKLTLAPGASKTEIQHAMQAHILGQAELMGTFHR